MHNISLTSTEYQSFRDEITKRIRSAQYEALKAVNKEMIALYWEIGMRITVQQTALGCGKPFPRYSKGVSGHTRIQCEKYVGYGTILL